MSRATELKAYKAVVVTALFKGHKSTAHTIGIISRGIVYIQYTRILIDPIFAVTVKEFGKIEEEDLIGEACLRS
jgi:hypothetical protein